MRILTVSLEFIMLFNIKIQTCVKYKPSIMSSNNC